MTTRQHLVPRHCCARFISEWAARSDLFYKFGNRFARVCNFFPPLFLCSWMFCVDHSRQWYFSVAAPQWKTGCFAWWRPVIAAVLLFWLLLIVRTIPTDRPTRLVSFLWSLIWLLCHALLFPADGGRSRSFMRVLTPLGVILNFSVGFHVAAAARPPFICTKTFPALRKREREISLRWKDFRVFRQWRQKHDANPLRSLSQSNFFQTTIRIEMLGKCERLELY